jgi:hypothetical protein
LELRCGFSRSDSLHRTAAAPGEHSPQGNRIKSG